MASKVESRLADMGLQLPKPWSPRGNFLPYRREGNIVFLSGQICEWDGAIVLEGPVGENVSVEAAHDAARICALNLLHALKLACEEDLDRVDQVIRLGGYVNCVPGFANSPAVINGATEVFIAAFEEAGRHCRTAIGVSGLPGNAAVEVDAIVRIS